MLGRRGGPVSEQVGWRAAIDFRRLLAAEANVNRFAVMVCAMVMLSACIGFEAPDTTTATTPAAIATTTTTVPTTTTIEPLLLGEVPFGDPNDPGALHPDLIWLQGVSPQSGYELCDNELEVIAGPGADQWGEANSAPLVLLPIEGDFTARVVLGFTPGAGWEFAGFGVRSPQDTTTWLRITRFQGGPEENEILVDAAFGGVNGDPVARAETAATSVTFEIERHGNRFALGYLAGSEWVALVEDYVIEIPEGAELYLVVGTLGDTRASHSFSHLVVRG